MMKLYAVAYVHNDSGYYGPSEMSGTRKWFQTLEEAQEVAKKGHKDKGLWASVVVLDMETLKEETIK